MVFFLLILCPLPQILEGNNADNQNGQYYQQYNCNGVHAATSLQ